MSELLALLDIGSNAARFVVVRIYPGQGYRVLRKDRFQTRLGAGRPGVLSRSAMRETIGAAQQFLTDVRATECTRPRAQRVSRVLAIATSAVRDAANQAKFFAAFEQATGVRIEVLSGEEEARLGAQTAVRDLAPQHGMIFDLGGGSLQLSRIQRGKIVQTSSLPLGVVRMTTQCVRHDPPLPRELHTLRQTVRDQIAPLIPQAQTGDMLIGMGGGAFARWRTCGWPLDGGCVCRRVGFRFSALNLYPW